MIRLCYGCALRRRVWSYALARGCPVLTSRMALVPGEGPTGQFPRILRVAAYHSGTETGVWWVYRATQYGPNTSIYGAMRQRVSCVFV
eukprot:2279182-Rhodomonas_salina.1